MNILNKAVLGVFAALSFSVLATAEEISFSRPEDWLQAKKLTVNGNALRVKGTEQLHSKTVFKAEDGCTYRLLGSLKMVPGSIPAPIHYGILPLDEKKMPLFDVNKASVTTVAQEAKAGATEIIIANGEKWQAAPNRKIALRPGTKEEKVLDGFPKKLSKEGNVWKIQLSKPLTADVAVGTAVAMKQPVPALYFEVARSSEKGIKDPKATSKTVWHSGIRYFRVIVLANWKAMPKGSPVPEIEMTDLRLQIE